MIKFSANLGFLWTNLQLPDAIRAAKQYGFQAVECHWPFEVPSSEVMSALQETNLTMLGLNTKRGNLGRGENGISAIPGREAEARSYIDEAIAYADQIDCRSIHVMAGATDDEHAHRVFVENLEYAATHTDRTILIEPLNPNDAPGYFLKTTDQAAAIIHEIGVDNIRLMFDCYHVGRTEGDVVTRFKQLQTLIGHVQFASVPDRGAPDQRGELDYQYIFKELMDAGWQKPIGAEYRPVGETEASLSWMTNLNR